MALNPPTEEQLEAIRLQAGFDEETIKKNAKEMLEWQKEQPHLPCGHDLQRLELLFLHCKGSQTKMKESLDMYYSMKHKTKNISINRNPDAQWFRDIKDIVYYFPLPDLTDGLCRVTVGGILDPCTSKHNTIHIIKLVNMVQDVRYLKEFCPSDVYILDMKKVTLAHVLRYPISTMKLVSDYGLVAYRVQFMSFHFINAPAYLNIAISLIKMILKPKLFKRIHVHRNGVGNLYDFVPRSVLPTEYGGDAGPIRELWNNCIEKVEQRREWFREQEILIKDEQQHSRGKKY